ncbi:MAG: phosphoribosylamine--glycine ligase [Blastocatellia bacterium]
MKILVIGSGGREHALVWKLSESPQVEKIYATPGNAGISQLAECVTAENNSPIALAELAARLEVDLTIVGPEAHLVAGVVDAFNRRQLAIVGPTRAAAALEGSKIFAKDFMSRHHLPTAAFTICESPESAYDIISSKIYGYPVVLKADGIAAGKGVVVAKDELEAHQAIQEMMVEKRLGEAGSRLVIEEFLEGRETSLLVFSDGKQVLVMPPAQDYKNVFDNNQGPNTGGMGTFSTPGLLDKALKEKLVKELAEKTITAMSMEGTPFKGILYLGLMLTESGVKILEYNVRFGDPEAQVILARLDSDLVDIFLGIANGDLSTVKVSWSDMSAVCVIMAVQGYPSQCKVGQVITGLEDAEKQENVKVFHAGTKYDDSGQVITSSGRVLGVMARQFSLEVARQQAYKGIKLINFEGQHYRKDIALLR